MDSKGKERGILKLEPRPRVMIDPSRSELTPQGSYDHPPCSPQPSVDRLSVTWADPGSMTSSGVNLFHLPSETPINNEVKFSPSAGDGSEDEDYSASLSAVLRQRRASVRRSRKGRSRRPSSPFLPDDNRPRRRSSVFTTSSGDTAISIEETQPAVVTQEQIFENIHLHKEVLGSVKQQPLGMRRKLKIVHQAKGYIKRHEGQLQERLAQSKSTRDIYARFNILLTTKWQQLKREAANTSNLLIPWELRIKEIESHFGSVVASYFTFLRWLFWVNLVIGFILLVFVIVPEYLTADPNQDTERKMIMEDEKRNATNLLTLWEFEGVLKCSAIFYGFYTNVERPEYRMPLAYFLTGLVVYIYSFVAILKKMAQNSRMSKLSEKEDECIFSWKLFTGWDFMIGNTETAHNRIASVILGFKEALLEEAEKKKDVRNWRIISLRTIVNICVIILLAASAYAVVTVVSHSENDSKSGNWWRENETTIVVTVISITFPVFFELLGYLEHYHPRKQLRLQLARIMLLNLLNLYSLIFALLNKIHGMTNELALLKPEVNVPNVPSNFTNITDSIGKIPIICFEEEISCGPCEIHITIPILYNDTLENFNYITTITNKNHDLVAENLLDESVLEVFMKHRQIIQTTKEKAMFENDSSNFIDYNDANNTDETNYTDDTNDTDDTNNTNDMKSSSVMNYIETRTGYKFTDVSDFYNKDIITDETNTNDFASPSEVVNISKKIEFYNYTTINNLSTNGNTTSDMKIIENSSSYDVLNSKLNFFNNNKITNYDYTFDFSTELNTNEYTNFSDDSSEGRTDGQSTFFSDDPTGFTRLQSVSNDIDENTTEYATDFSSENRTLGNEENTNLTTNEFSSSNFQENQSEEDVTVLKSTQTYYKEIENFPQRSSNIFTGITTTVNIEKIENTVTGSSNSDTAYEETITTHFPITREPTKTTDIISTKMTNNNMFDKTAVLTDLKSTANYETVISIDRICPNISFNCTLNCGGRNITQVFIVTNCTVLRKACYRIRCRRIIDNKNGTIDNFSYIDEEITCKGSEEHNKKKNENNSMDIAYKDEHNRTIYNLSIPTKKKLSKLCWETMFGQELVKLTMMDLVFVLLGTLFMDFFRAIFVRYTNRCWCWDLEKKFPEYGDFKIAENILHLINNQGMVWMGMFFSPGLVIINVIKLMIMMYLRSWAVMTCNVPHEVVFRVSKSNNFYLALLLTMLFLCVLPVGYTIVRVTPSWHCGPFSEYDRIYCIVTTNIYKVLPPGLYSVLEYIASPAIVIPLLVLLILIIYYLTSLTNSLREANNDLKIQLRRERTEERRKMFQLADTRRRAGSSAMDNTPFARWKKALPSLPLSKSIDSDDRKTITAEETVEPLKTVKRRGGIFAKIVGLALDKKTDVDAVSEVDGASALSNNVNDETDTDFHESLPKEVLKAKDITMAKHEPKKKNSVEFKVNKKKEDKSLRVKLEKLDYKTEKKANIEKQAFASGSSDEKYKSSFSEDNEVLKERNYKKKQTSQSSTQSRQSDSIGSVIPVITISTTESDEEILSKTKTSNEKGDKQKPRSSDLKSLRRQSSVDSINEQKLPKDKKPEEGPKYQYSL